MLRLALVWFVSCAFLCLWSGDVTSANTTSQLRRIEVDGAGQILGFEVQISQRPRMSLWISGAGRVQWLMVSLASADVLVAPGGTVSLGQLAHRGSGRIGVDNIQRFVYINQTTFSYQTQNQMRLDSMTVPSGEIKFEYNMDGRFRQIGQIKLRYLNHGVLKKVLQTTFAYDQGKAQVKEVASLPIVYHNSSRVASIGQAAFQYHDLLGHIISLTGQESRTQIQVVWHNTGNCSGFQRRGGLALPRKFR